MKMEAARSSKMLVSYRLQHYVASQPEEEGSMAPRKVGNSVWQHNPEDFDLNLHCRENAARN